MRPNKRGQLEPRNVALYDEFVDGSWPGYRVFPNADATQLFSPNNSDDDDDDAGSKRPHPSSDDPNKENVDPNTTHRSTSTDSSPSSKRHRHSAHFDVLAAVSEQMVAD